MLESTTTPRTFILLNKTLRLTLVQSVIPKIQLRRFKKTFQKNSVKSSKSRTKLKSLRNNIKLPRKSTMSLTTF